jgi:hypothetical protein
MSKYDQEGGFERVPRDFYPTPSSANKPLVSLLGTALFTYWEPCCGGNDLVKGLAKYIPNAKCVSASDITTDCGITKSVFDITADDVNTVGNQYFITNPPWINTSKDEFQLFRMIHHLAALRPTIMLLNANICWNESSWNGKLAPMPICHWVKPIGRVKWIPDSPFSGKEDCAWFYFDKSNTMQHMFPTIIHPRDPREKKKETQNGL